MHKSVIIGLLLLTAGLFGVVTLNNIISHAMAQGYNDNNYHGDNSYSKIQPTIRNMSVEQVPLKAFL